MSTLTHSVIRNCQNCGADLPLGTQACPNCHTLIYGRELDALAGEARGLESRGEFAQARELWNRSLTLLPPDSKQAEWVRQKMRSLQQSEAAGPSVNPASTSTKPPPPNWVKKLGPLGPVALFLLKAKSLLLAIFKLKFLFSFFLFVGLYSTLFGWRFGVGFAVCILIHEMGHFIDIKRRGLPAEMPVFLPGLGAYVRWTTLGVTKRQVAQISLAGPLAGWIAASVCFLIYAQTRDPLWAALARTGAVLNILNLIPVWILDGGKAIDPLAAVDRAALLAATLALWMWTTEPIFILVAAGIVWRLFTKDKPQQSDWATWTYFAAILLALGILLHATTGILAARGIQSQ
jgi:Zn-dependent protease